MAEHNEVNDCWREFHTAKASEDSAMAVIQEKVASATAQTTAIDDLKAMVTRQALAGQAAIDRERNRKSGGYAFHYWLNETVDRFKREMEWARRLTYLAMRAVESEFRRACRCEPTFWRRNIPTSSRPSYERCSRSRPHDRSIGGGPKKRASS